MVRSVLRVFIVTPFAALALIAFCVALLVEWFDDLSHTCPPSENLP